MFSASRIFSRNLLALVLPYFRSEEKWSAIGLVFLIVALNLGAVYINVLFNDWNRLFYDSLQDKNIAAFWHQLMRFSLLAAIFIAVAVYQTYINQMLQIRWRQWLTGYFLDEWLKDRTYYRLQLKHLGGDNPDQRIADDVDSFVDQTLSLSVGILSSTVTFISFVTILWTLSGRLSFSLWGHAISIPGYMVWAALVYAGIGSFITHRIGRPLVGLNFDQQKFEANFRFSLVRFRENTEPVALYAGERDERLNFGQQFSHIATNWWNIMRRQKKLSWFSSGYNQVATIFPFIVAVPRYFAGKFQLGNLMQTVSAFGSVQESVSYFISAYTDFASWQAVVDRLTTFRLAIAAERSTREAVTRRAGKGNDFVLDQLTVRLPDGNALFENMSLDIPAGSRVLITGRSGTGKSTLFRALSGIWPFGSGTLESPERARILFISQKPYLPIASLGDAIAYPHGEEASREAVADALKAVGLGSLSGSLDEMHNWTLELSPGEQQRIGFARALVTKPDWLFLDEATSSLDEESEAMLYGLIEERLPGTTLVSIAHRPQLRRFHHHELKLDEGMMGGLRPITVDVSGN